MVIDVHIDKMNKLKKNDLLIFNGKSFQPIDFNDLVHDLIVEIEELKMVIHNQNVKLENYDKKINRFIELMKGGK